jgi:hypothetical protein
MVPSMLCQFHSTPSFSPYSASHARHSFSKNLAGCHCKKCLCIALDLPPPDLPVCASNAVPSHAAALEPEAPPLIRYHPRFSMCHPATYLRPDFAPRFRKVIEGNQATHDLLIVT